MTDIVERLRVFDASSADTLREAFGVMMEAADEIERLRADVGPLLESVTALELENDRLRAKEEVMTSDVIVEVRVTLDRSGSIDTHTKYLDELGLGVAQILAIGMLAEVKDAMTLSRNTAIHASRSLKGSD